MSNFPEFPLATTDQTQKGLPTTKRSNRLTRLVSGVKKGRGR